MSRERYLSACHAMQSGVAMEMNHTDMHSPKHLRVGVNSAMCDNAALVRLLISKGIITEEEHLQVVTEEMEREVKRYEETISKRFGGAAIKLA